MRISRNNTKDFPLKHNAETTVRKMTLWKVSWCVLMAVWLLAMADAEDERQEENRLKGLNDDIIYVGTEADFFCMSPVENCVGMTWYRHIPGTERETIFNECSGIYLSDKYTVKDTTSLGCRLIVKNAELNDTGFVICQIRISKSRLVEGSARLAVVINDTKNESTLKGLENSFSVVGSNATFTCVSPFKDCGGMTWFTYKPGTQPITVYDWRQRNYLVVDREKYIVENATWSCQLTVKNIDLTDAGFVGCSIRISGRPFSATASLTVITY